MKIQYQVEKGADKLVAFLAGCVGHAFVNGDTKNQSIMAIIGEPGKKSTSIHVINSQGGNGPKEIVFREFVKADKVGEWKFILQPTSVRIEYDGKADACPYFSNDILTNRFVLQNDLKMASSQ